MAVLMELSRIIISELTETQVIVLREVGGERKFSIALGSTEAQAIDRRLKGLIPVRPLTHDLLAAVIEHLGAHVERIAIVDLRNHTFFASLTLQRDGESIDVDARPSDAIALGVATGVPIYVAEHVLAQVC